MARVEARVVVPVSVEVAFAVSQTQGSIRYRWDSFVRSQQLLDGASLPGKGVRTETRSRHGLTIRPGVAGPLVQPIGLKVLQHDIDRRIAGFARGCEDPVVAAATDILGVWSDDKRDA